MTVSTQITKETFSTNGVTVDFPFTFYLTSEDQVFAKTIEADGTETDYTTYTVTINPDNNGGTLTTNTVLDNVDLLIFRDTEITQETDYPRGNKFPAKSHEAALDKLTLIDQEQQEEIDRSLKTSIGDSIEFTVGNIDDGDLIQRDGDLIVGSGVKAQGTEPNSVMTFDKGDTRYYNIAGDSLEGQMNANNQRIVNLPEAAGGTEPVRKQDADGDYLNVTGDNMLGTLNMNNNRITSLPVPVDDREPLRKGDASPVTGPFPTFEYVDDTAEDRSWAGDSQQAGAPIWPVNSQESAQVGDNLTGYSYIRLQGGDFSSIYLFELEKADGSGGQPSGNLDSSNLTTKPYSCVIGGETFYLGDQVFDNDDIRYYWADAGEASNTPMIQAAVNVQKNKFKRVRIPEYIEFNSTGIVTVDDFIEFYGRGTIKGNGLGDCIDNKFVSMSINGPTLRNYTNLVTFSGDCDGDFKIEATYASFFDYRQGFIITSLNYISGSVEWVSYNCDYSQHKEERTIDGLFDVFWNGVPISSCQFSLNRFKNGGKEAINFQGTTRLDPENGNYTIFGNVFEDYIGNSPGGGEFDVHFIRCYGNRASITGNTFRNLDVTDGTDPSDCEAIRPQCRDLVIDGNTFEDAGYDEGWISLKLSERTIVNDNKFTCTDARNTRAISLGVNVLAILANVGTKISSNVFSNFGRGPVITTQDGQGIPEEAITIESNKFYDCSPASTSQSILRLSATQSEFYLSGNKVYYTASAEKCQSCVSMLEQEMLVFMDDNYWVSGDAAFFLSGTTPARSIQSKGDTFDCNRIFSNSGQVTESISITDFEIECPNSVHEIFGTLGTNILCPLVTLRGTRTMRDVETPARVASVRGQNDSLLSYNYTGYISNRFTQDGRKARHTAVGVLFTSQAGVRTETEPFTAAVLQSPSDTAREWFQPATGAGQIQPQFRDYPTGGAIRYAIKVDFDITILGKEE